MEFHGIYGIARVNDIVAPQVPWYSMELLVSSKLAHSKFHGIPWNCSCQRNWRTPSSAKFAQSKFHGIPCFFLFNGTVVSSIRWVLNLDRIPWNLSFQILTNWYFIINIFALYRMHFRHYSLRIKISFKISFQCPLKLNLTKNFGKYKLRSIWINFIIKDRIPNNYTMVTYEKLRGITSF